jgi:hypothetical protein
MRSIQSFLSVLCVLSFLGCGGTSPMPDAAVARDAAPTDAFLPDAAMPDAAIDVDAATPDAGDVDGGDPCDACTGDHACLRGVCIATCGVELAAYDAVLAEGLVPVANYCRTPAAFGFAGTRVYEVSASTVGLVTTFTLSRWTPGAGAPTPEEIGTAMYTAVVGDAVFIGGSVAVSPDEAHVVFGFTTNPSFVGGVFDVATGGGLAMESDAPGNFGATFADATHYLINGMGLAPASAGQGLYRGVAGSMMGVEVVDHLGEYSGSVAVWGDEALVLAGGTSFGMPWADGETGDRVLVLPLADVIEATTAIDGSAAPQLVAPSAFALISGPRLASVHYDGSFMQDGIEVRALSRATDGTVTVSAPESLTTGATFTTVVAADDEIILAHAGGLLFVR